MHHLGAGICSHSLTMVGAIFREMVPATIMRSDWRGAAAETVQVESARPGRHHLDGAAGQTEGHRPEGVGSKLIEHIFHNGQADDRTGCYLFFSQRNTPLRQA
jgi:hypothetical protein